MSSISKLNLKGVHVSSESGFSVVQVLVMSGIVLVLGAAVLANHASIEKFQSRMVAGTARGGVSKTLHFNASSPYSLYKSSVFGSTVLQNSPLAACLCGESTCVPDVEVPFNLMDVGGNIVAGDSTQKKKFGSLVEFCSGATNSCVFEGSASFSCTGVNCGTYVTTATDPSLKVSYSFGLTSEAMDQHKEFGYLKGMSETVSVPVASVRTYGTRHDLCVTGGGISPTYGLIYGGDSIRISGTGLQRLTGVLFDGVPCVITTPKVIVNGEIRYQTSKSITCINPPHAPGYASIVLLYGKNERYDLTTKFLYYDPPPPPPPPPPSAPPSGPVGYWRCCPTGCFGPGGTCPQGQCSPIGTWLNGARCDP